MAICGCTSPFPIGYVFRRGPPKVAVSGRGFLSAVAACSRRSPLLCPPVGGGELAIQLLQHLFGNMRGGVEVGEWTAKRRLDPTGKDKLRAVWGRAGCGGARSAKEKLLISKSVRERAGARRGWSLAAPEKGCPSCFETGDWGGTRNSNSRVL